MRFIEFLQKQASWRAKYRDIQVTPAVVRSYLASMNQPELSDVNSEKLHVFCVYTPVHALLAYFIGSYLGLDVAIVSPRGLPKLLDGMEDDVLGHMFVPKGYKAPSSSWPSSVFSIDMSLPMAPQQTPTLSWSTREARFIFCTSGTTGKAKRVVHRESILIANGRMVTDYLSLDEKDHSYCVFPLQFMYGLSTTLCTLWSNSTITFDEFVMPSLVSDYVMNNKITVLPILGEWSDALSQRWNRGKYDPERLILINASDRLLKKQAEEVLPWASAFWNNLGQTESAPRLLAVELVRQTNLENITFKETIAAGFPAGKQIKLKLKNVKDGVGNLYYKTPFFMIGYLQDNGSILPPNEWHDSGDLFSQRNDGLWFWVGRSSHTIKVNGELVPLTAVTNVLLNKNNVSGVGYTTNKNGELCAFVESNSKCKVFENELLTLLADKLRGKRSRVRLISKLPRTENGKIDFTQLRLSSTDSAIALANID